MAEKTISQSKDKTNLVILGIVAIVAIVGLVLLFTKGGSSSISSEDLAGEAARVSTRVARPTVARPTVVGPTIAWADTRSSYSPGPASGGSGSQTCPSQTYKAYGNCNYGDSATGTVLSDGAKCCRQPSCSQRCSNMGYQMNYPYCQNSVPSAVCSGSTFVGYAWGGEASDCPLPSKCVCRKPFDCSSLGSGWQCSAGHGGCINPTTKQIRSVY